jgi:hypothetical protein
VIPASLTTFERVFKKEKYAIHELKKDWCDVCSQMEINGTDIPSSEHYIQQNAALLEKEELKALLKTPEYQNVEAFCQDLEAALPCTRLMCRAQFFKTKLLLHNFTTYDLKTRAADCYVFTELDACHDHDVYATLVEKHLDVILGLKPETKKVIIYSDSCSHQNKNQYLGNVLLHYAITHSITIEHRNLVVGHTHMEVDSFHSLIEHSVRNVPVFDPQDYMEHMALARNIKSVSSYDTQVHRLNYKDFNRYYYKYVNSLRPGNRSEDPVVMDVRAFQYLPSGKIQYKMLVEEDFKDLPQKVKIAE